MRPSGRSPVELRKLSITRRYTRHAEGSVLIECGETKVICTASIDEKVPMFPKWRGKQVLMRDENGLEKCVACGLCSVACPADAIYLEAAENDGSVMAGPRYASVYQIHKTRCIFCGYCEEACPVSAIFMGKDYELAVYSKDDFVWDKTELLVPAPTK